MALNLSNNEHEYPFIIGNTKIPFFYTPRANPYIAEFSYKKTYNKTQAIGGFSFEPWGREPISLHVEMRVIKSGALVNTVGFNKDSLETLGFRDPLITTEADVIKRLFELDQRPIKSLAAVSEEAAKSSNAFTRGLGKTAGFMDSAYSNVAGLGTTIRSLVTKGTAPKVERFANRFSDTIIYYKANIYSGFFDNFKIIEDATTPFFNKVSYDFMITSSIADALNETIAQSIGGRTIAGILGGVSAATTLTALIDSATSSIPNLINEQVKF